MGAVTTPDISSLYLPSGLGGPIFPEKSFHPIQSSLTATLGQKQKSDPVWYPKHCCPVPGCRLTGLCSCPAVLAQVLLPLCQVWQKPGVHHPGRQGWGDLLQRLLRQELWSQGLWLWARRWGTRPLTVRHQELGCLLAQGLSIPACAAHPSRTLSEGPHHQ